MSAKTRKLQRKSKVKRRRDTIPWKYCVLTVICGLFLVAGFFYAARQHFSSMEYGMKNAKLRKQIDELSSEKRRLQLSKEIALSPAEIKKAAQKMGFTTMTASNIEVVKPKLVSSEILDEGKESNNNKDKTDSKVADELDKKNDITEITFAQEKDKKKENKKAAQKKKDENSKRDKRGQVKKSEPKKDLGKEKTDKLSENRKSRPQIAKK